jgi:hypothetical protein
MRFVGKRQQNWHTMRNTHIVRTVIVAPCVGDNGQNKPATTI